MRGREDESFSSISPTFLSVKTMCFLSLVLLLRLTATDIISKAVSSLFPVVCKYLSPGQLARLQSDSNQVTNKVIYLSYQHHLVIVISFPLIKRITKSPKDLASSIGTQEFSVVGKNKTLQDGKHTTFKCRRCIVTVITNGVKPASQFKQSTRAALLYPCIIPHSPQPFNKHTLSIWWTI